jgi:NitT/TauT family transport system permease protein
MLRQSASPRSVRIAFQRPVTLPQRIVLGVLAWLLFLGLWQYAATAGLAPQRLFPPPTQVVSALQELFVTQNFHADVLASLERVAVSFLLAFAIALPLGLFMGAFPVVAAFFNPLVSPFRYLPAPAFIPLLLMWLGAGDAQKIALLFLGVVWFLVTLIADHVRSVKMELIETALTLGASTRQVLGGVVLRASLPGLVDIARQMLAVSWTYLVIAEIVAATDGIGAMIMRARRFVRVDEVMAGIVMIGILGLVLDLLFRLLHWRLFPYARQRSIKT